MSTLKRVAKQPTWLLSRANNRAQALIAEAFAAQGVRGFHFRLLAALDQYGPASQADLGRHTGIDRSDIAATVHDMIVTGLTERQPDTTDRRRNVVTITPHGMEILTRLDASLKAAQRTLLSPLTPSERKTFVALLSKLLG